MKKLILTGLLLLICPINGFSQATTGYHRVNQVLARAPQNVQAQVVPYAKIAVSITSTGAAAVIYSDPGLSVQITPPVLTSDVAGNYGYYLSLNYMVTETISSPSLGSVVIPNIGINGPIVGTLTTTGATSDVVSITGILSTSHVALQPTNASAATMFASTYVSSKSVGSITVTHPATSGATFDLIITPY